MDVLEAIMKIVTDLFLLNNIPGGTTDAIVGGISGFVQAIMFIYDMLEKLFKAVQG